MRTFPRAAWLQCAAAAALGLAAPVAAHAQSKAEAEVTAAFEAAQKTAVHGPSAVKLAEQATMRLPEGFAYVPPAESGRIMTAMGNRVGEGLLGLVFPGDDPNANWFVVIRYIDAGYIRDDDAKDWNADELLKNLKAGTDDANLERRGLGIPELYAPGSAHAPRNALT